jgi:phage-related protein
MALPTFNPPLPPAPQSRVTPNYRIMLTQFGDGYEQRAADGVSTLRKTAYLKWDNLKTVELDEITAFFDALLGFGAFYWTEMGAAAPSKWVVDTQQQSSYQVTWTNPNIASLQVTLRQVFDLGA